MKRLFINLFFYLVAFEASYGATIIIDPGHGGKDLGAKVSYWTKKKIQSKLKVVLEKDITLSVAKIIYKKLKAKGHRVYLSRTHDRTVSLQSRSEMADKVSADLFISIHANSSLHPSSRGVETFYLDNHKDKTIKHVEQLENSSFTTKDPIVQQILRDLVISKTAPLSKILATKIHHELSKGVMKKYRLKNRGIRPGLFYVLALSQRPAVLLEVGFLSNPQERKMILGSKFQEDYASAVVKGIDLWAKGKGENKAKLPLL